MSGRRLYESYLARALGMARNVEIDYLPVQVAVGDLLLLATDGVYEHVDAAEIRARWPPPISMRRHRPSPGLPMRRAVATT